MGVTLERVQFKFASIIGELCSEPDILSQFAVWVDLRLAEYKLKGSISLDCSGDTPDPVWLKGILSALLAKRLAKKREQSKPLGHSFGSGSPSSDVNYSRMRSRQSLPSHTESLHADESVVSVKDEPFDDVVYPVGLHAHEISRSPRKRSVAESLRGEDDGEQADIMYAHSMPKQSRSDNQTNESLMSIIGGENRQENNATSHSGFEQITETIDLIVDSEERGNSSLDATDMPSSFPLLDTSNDNNFSSLTTVVPEKFPPSTQQLSKRVRSDARKFQNWLNQQAGETPMEMVDPVELDGYLASFLGSVKTANGDDYDPDSLYTLRTNIDRYLKSCNYQYSLTKSDKFSQSQTVMRLRRQQLKEDATLNPSELSSLLATGLIGIADPQSLLQTVYVQNSFHFGQYLKSKSDHTALLWGDLELRTDTFGRETVVLTGNASRLCSKKGRLGRSTAIRPLRACADVDNLSACPVAHFKEYKRRRSSDNLAPQARFYLTPLTDCRSDIWFSDSTGVDNLYFAMFVREMKARLSALKHT